MSDDEALPDIPELRFEGGLPGFPGVERFVLERWGDDDSPFSLLRALEDGLEFLVVPPALFFPGYAPEIADETVERLGISTADDAVLLAIVTLGEPVASSTANLVGPVVVNRHTRQAAQVVVDETGWDLHQPLVAG